MELRKSLCPNIFASPGGTPRDVVAHSHFFDPLAPGGGRSRRWGDAAEGIQTQVISEIVRQAPASWSERDLAFALSVARVESGFNPDAAAGSSSASGVGQFIDRTGSAYGISNENRFEIRAGVRAFITHLGENLTRARKVFQQDDAVYARAYGLHHDGPSLQYGGEAIGKERVLPLMKSMLEFLRCNGIS